MASLLQISKIRQIGRGIWRRGVTYIVLIQERQFLGNILSCGVISIILLLVKAPPWIMWFIGRASVLNMPLTLHSAGGFNWDIFGRIRMKGLPQVRSITRLALQNVQGKLLIQFHLKGDTWKIILPQRILVLQNTTDSLGEFRIS